jgi:hypothetical protein
MDEVSASSSAFVDFISWVEIAGEGGFWGVLGGDIGKMGNEML